MSTKAERAEAQLIRDTLKAIRALGGLVASCSEDGEYRVTFTGLSASRAEAVAYYTDDATDALDTAEAMLRNKRLTDFVDTMKKEG